MDISKLKEMHKILAPSGHECKLTDFISNEIKPYVDEVYTDNMGNLIARKGCNSDNKVMIECGIDECGVMVVSIDEKGLVYFASVGEAEAKYCVNQPVEFMDGISGIIRTNKTDINSVEFSDLFADIDAGSKEIAEKLLKIGEFGVFSSSLRAVDDIEKTVKATNLSYRTPPFILLNVIQNIKKTNAKLYFVFSTQKQLGGRGVKVAISNINPDVLVSINTCNESKNISCGNGLAMLAKDAKTIASTNIKERLIKNAEDSDIPYQIYVGNEDFKFSGVLSSGSNCLTGGVLVPMKYKGQPYETVNITDVENAQKLLLRYIGNL